MRKSLGLGLAIALASAMSSDQARAQATVAANYATAQWTNEELDNLLAPVALYPDPILAQVLVAASYPDQIEQAARHVGIYGQNRIDDQPWDISVRAVAHYAPVLNLMADRIDWTTALGQAYAEQPEDVMGSVQSLRNMARAHGNLVSTSEQQVVMEDRYVRILPARPQVIYVPVYDPLVVYHRPIVHLGVYRSGWSFGLAFPIGVWLNYDVDWGHRHVYYHGWDVRGRRHGWYHRSRPYIVVNNIYVHQRPTIVVVNRRVIDRRVNYGIFDRYNYVHRQVTWERRSKYDDRRYATGGGSWDRDRGGDRYDRGDRRDNDGRYDRGGDYRRDNDRQRAPSWDRGGRANAAPSTGPRTGGNNGNDRPNGNGASNGNRGGNGNTGNRPQVTPRSRVAEAPTTSGTKRSNDNRYMPRGGGAVNGATASRQNDRVRATPAPTRSAPQRVATQRSAPDRVSGQRTAPQRAAPQRSTTQRAAPQRVVTQRSAPQRSEPRAQSAPRSAPKASSSSGRVAQSRGAKAPSESRSRRGN